MNMNNVMSKELVKVLKRTSSDEFFSSVITLDEDFLFMINSLQNLKADENNLKPRKYKALGRIKLEKDW